MPGPFRLYEDAHREPVASQHIAAAIDALLLVVKDYRDLGAQDTASRECILAYIEQNFYKFG